MERPEKVVIDASVAVKWYNVEEHTSEAIKLRNDYVKRKLDLAAPYLLLYEVVNSLRYNPDFGVDDVKQALLNLTELQIDLKTPDQEQCENAVEIAFRYGVTVYDAVYLSLAVMEETTLFTADEKMLSKVKMSNVRHIREYH